MSTTPVSTNGSVTHLPFLHVITFHHDVSMTRSDIVTDITMQWKRISTITWENGHKSKLAGWKSCSFYVTGDEAEVEASCMQQSAVDRRHLCFVLFCAIFIIPLPIPTLNFTLSPFHYANLHRPR